MAGREGGREIRQGDQTGTSYRAAGREEDWQVGQAGSEASRSSRQILQDGRQVMQAHLAHLIHRLGREMGLSALAGQPNTCCKESDAVSPCLKMLFYLLSIFFFPSLFSVCINIFPHL